MTGIRLPETQHQRPNKVELPGERYTRLLKGVPERYSILQVGVALFHRNPDYKAKKAGADCAQSHRNLAAGNDNNDEHAFIHREGTLNQDELEVMTEREEETEGNENDGENNDDGDDENNSAATAEEEQSEYTSRIYNFYLFPNANGKSSAREVTLNPSAVGFLLENHMDFDKVFREGIPFTTMEQAKVLKNKYFEKYNKKDEEEKGGEDGKKSEGNNTPRKNRLKVTRVEDIAFVARTMAGLREWIDSDHSMQNPLADGIPGQAAATTDVANENNANAANGGGNGNDGAGGNTNGNGGGARLEEGTSLVLPPCNAFLRRCLYETIEDEYPGLILERADLAGPCDPVARNQIRVIRLSPAEKKLREARLRQERWDRLLQDIGFTTIFQAISDACNGKTFNEEQTSGFLNGLSPGPSVEIDGQKAGKQIPLVIHNGLHDLMFLLTHCHNPRLPEAFEDTKNVIRNYFPIVQDTKVLATEFSDAIIRGGKTDLGGLYHTTCNTGDSDDSLLLKIPSIVNKDGRSQGQAHEAAWDAYMTGCVFNALCNQILESKNRLNVAMTLDGLLHDSSVSLLREWIGINKIYMHMSLFTIDLEDGLHDPLSKGLSVDTSFHVSGISTSVSTRDILQALSVGNESEYEVIRLLKYEIIWVDDTSFFVGSRTVNGVCSEDADTRGLIASHVRNKLYAGLGDLEIIPLGTYFKKKYSAPEPPASGGMVSSIVSVATKPFEILGNMMGFGKKPSNDNQSNERASKRRRHGD